MKTDSARTFALADAAATEAFGARIAAALRRGDAVFLKGALGAGKTTLARGVVRALTGTQDDIPSPTYSLVQIYEGGPFTVWHCDLYRLEDAAESREFGLEDALADGVLLVEWPERLTGFVAPDRLEVTLTPDAADGGRTALALGWGTWRTRLDDL